MHWLDMRRHTECWSDVSKEVQVPYTIECDQNVEVVIGNVCIKQNYLLLNTKNVDTPIWQ